VQNVFAVIQCAVAELNVFLSSVLCPDFHQIKTFGGTLVPHAPLPTTTVASNVLLGLGQVFPTFLLPCTPSAFRQMNMDPYSISTDKDVPLQNFDR